jgi:hypothetical protein
MLSSSAVAALSAPSSLFFYVLASACGPVSVFFLVTTLGVQVGRILLPPLLLLLPLHRVTHWPKRISFAVQSGAVATAVSATAFIVARVASYDVTALLVWYATATAMGCAVAVRGWRGLHLLPQGTPLALQPWWLRTRLFPPALALLALAVCTGLTLGPLVAAAYAAAGLVLAGVGGYRARATAGPDPSFRLRSESNEINLSAVEHDMLPPQPGGDDDDEDVKGLFAEQE